MTTIKIVYGKKSMADADYAVNQAVGSWQEAQKRTQVALVSILFNLYKSKDGETAVKRMNTLTKGAKGGNTKAIVEYGVLMGFKCDKEGFKVAPATAEIKERVGEGFKKAKDLEWWTLKPVNPFDGYDLNAALNSLLSKAHKMEKAANEDPEMGKLIKIDTDLLSALESIKETVAA